MIKHKSKIKFCGINNLDILDELLTLKPDFVGFITYKESPRSIDLNFLVEVSKRQFKHTTPVIVFVNESKSSILDAIQILPNAILQFHGDESPEFCNQFNQDFWKTIRIKDSNSLRMKDSFKADAILLETYKDNHYGGTGKSFDWSVLKGLKLSDNFILAGGINGTNLNNALMLTPWCIDINSGVENSSGTKDIKRVKEIFKIKLAHEEL